MPRIKSQGDVVCNCLHGQAYMDASGNCGCTSNTTNTSIPPMPLTPLPAGYVWKWNGTRWMPTRTKQAVDMPLTNGAISPTFFDKAKVWARQNPLLALAIGTGAFYLVTKGK